MPKKILIVDDHEDTRELLKIFIEDLGHETLEAGDGYEGIRLVRLEKPNLVFMDISLPLLDGLSATKIIRDFTDVPKMPIIAITSYRTSLRRKAIEAGCNDLIMKPLYYKDLDTIFKQYLES